MGISASEILEQEDEKKVNFSAMNTITQLLYVLFFCSDYTITQRNPQSRNICIDIPNPFIVLYYCCFG